MHLFTFFLMTPPLFASSYLSFCVSSVHPHISPPASPAPGAAALFSICLSRGAKFWGTMSCFHLLSTQLDQPKALWSHCPSNAATGSQHNYQVKPSCANTQALNSSKSLGMWLTYMIAGSWLKLSMHEYTVQLTFTIPAIKKLSKIKLLGFCN